MLEHHADAEPRDVVRGPTRDLPPSTRTEPASGRSMPMIDFITVDLPDPFGPIKPENLAGLNEKLMS